MFSFFKTKINKQSNYYTNPVNAEPSKVAPNTGITYKKNLISKYKTDHEQLLSLYGLINNLYQTRNYEEASKKLNEMRVALPAHILDEELNFYIYLKHCYHLDKDTQELMMKQRKDIKVIGLSAINFLKKYSKMGSGISDDPDFEKDFEELGQILTKRISMEENELYPLYCPPE